MKKHILLATLAATAALVVGCGTTSSAEKTDTPDAAAEPKPAEGDAAAPAEPAPAASTDTGGGW